jgi:hypothetical protein
MRAKAFTGVVAAAGRDDAIDENDAIEFYAPEADNATEALMPLLDDVLKRLDLGPLFAGPQDEAETAA